jgi:imidazolonepropionase-like amidohydrolase
MRKLPESICMVVLTAGTASLSPAADTAHPIVLRAAHLLEVDTGRLLSPAELLVEGERITAVGTAVAHPAGCRVVELGSATLVPGLIDVHVHLFLHPGLDEDLQTVKESVPMRTLLAAQAARADLMAGFTAERDMGTEGAGSADSAVRDAINAGLIEGPRLKISGNAVSIVGGHEDAIHFNPDVHMLSNATYANNAAELVGVIRQQHKEGADFVKIYETGRDEFRDGALHTPYQYTLEEMKAAVNEAARLGGSVAVHAQGEPGTLYAAQAGVASIDHATQLSEETMRLMKAKNIPAVPTFTVFDHFAHDPESAAREAPILEYKIREFKRQIAAGVPFAVGSDVGPFAHGTQAEELVLMARFGMKPLEVLQAEYLNGARLMGLAGQIGELKSGYFADVLAVPGSPLADLEVMKHVSFVMKAGRVVREAAR